MTRRLVVLLALAVAAACASFAPATLHGAIRPLLGERGSCTAWAIGPSKWITAAHCVGNVDTLDGTTIEWLAVDAEADIALLRGPAAAHVLRLSMSEPALGDTLRILGYGLARPTLLMLPGLYIAGHSDFFKGRPPEMLMGGANGMPGMSGGPVLWQGRVVSMVTGGGTPASYAHSIGTGVSWSALARFVARTHATRP